MAFFRNLLSRKDGFIAIIAVAIFALLAIFGATIQLTVMDTYQNVKALNNYYSSRDVTDSVMEYINNQLNSHEAGYNLQLDCRYGKYAEATGGGNAWQNAEACDTFNNFGTNSDVAKNVKIKVSVKGRAEESENVKTGKCGSGFFGSFNDDCYVMPFPGTGSAGSSCSGYKPIMSGDAGDAVMTQEVSGFVGLDQLDHPCNWNKLIFGSSIVDRVSVPFYYDEGDGDEQQTVNPFKKDDPNGLAAADNFILRLRTPCKPCGKKNANGVLIDAQNTRDCSGLPEPLLCEPDDRFVLDTGANNSENDIVVQWKLSGKCDSDEDGAEDDSCAMVAVPGNPVSALNEAWINEEKEENYSLLENKTKGSYTNAYPPSDASFLGSEPGFPAKLSNFSQPILNLFLSSALISDAGKNIPYLEYQVLTDEPIGNSRTVIKVEVVVDDNAFVKTIYKDVKKELIDFAVQN